MLTHLRSGSTSRVWNSGPQPRPTMAEPPEKATASMAEHHEKAAATPRCRVCAQPAKTLKCARCKTPYCSAACQTVDWKERGHKATCKRLVKVTPTPTSKPTKTSPPVVEGPARGPWDIALAKAVSVAAAANAAPARAPPAAERGPAGHCDERCPVCLEDWDVNATPVSRICCCRFICKGCEDTMGSCECPLCRAPIAQSDDTNLALLRRHAENNNPVAICLLGECYGGGKLGLVPSNKKAVRCFQRAADLGNITAMNHLGIAYVKGSGVKLDKKKAAAYYRMAADRGDAEAQFNFGNCLAGGNGVAQDHAEARRFFELAANQGYTEAEHNLGCVYAKGYGVAPNAAEAASWLERAATKGYERASTALAVVRRRQTEG